MGIIAHQQIKKTGLSETHLEVKQRVDQLEEENQELLAENKILKEKYSDEILIDMKNLSIENRKLKAALKKLEKENEKLKNPPIWKNDGEL